MAAQRGGRCYYVGLGLGGEEVGDNFDVIQAEDPGIVVLLLT